MGTLVSICIPTYKRLHYLREAVASARQQTHTDVEILISDDGTEEAILAFAREQERIDPRVRFARNDRQLGLGGNWNAVIQRARGEYLVIIGDDDRLKANFAERLLAARLPGTAVLFSNQDVIDEHGARNERLTREFPTIYARAGLPAGEVADAPACVWKNSVPMMSALVRTVDAQRLGIKTDLNTPEIELFARLAAEGKRFVFVPESLAEYRVHPMSATSGGLAGERLIVYLDPIEVPPHVEPLKRAFMQRLVLHAVSKSLRGGDVEGARAMLRHRYYPRLASRPAHVVVQRTLSALPRPLSRWTFGLVAGTMRQLRRGAAARG